MHHQPLQKKNRVPATGDHDKEQKGGLRLPAVPVLQNEPVQKMDPEEKWKYPHAAPAQLVSSEEDELLQQPDEPFQLVADENTQAQRPNNTGLPDHLKDGIENLSGFSMDDVKVHYNSDKPAQLQALAYAQGTDIHVAPGQERHLPHEAWHVVQQKQGRVQPTMQMKEGVAVNDDKGLENEADRMGKEAFNFSKNKQSNAFEESGVLQQKEFVAQKVSAIQFGKPNSESTETDIQESSMANPFQIVATQFNARYDIWAFRNEIKSYFNQQHEKSKTPVFELRMYDGVNPGRVDGYMKEAKAQIKELVENNLFQLTMSWLRNESQVPQANDGRVSEELHKEFVQIVKSFAGNFKGKVGRQEEILANLKSQINDQEKKDLLQKEYHKMLDIGDPLQMLEEGRIMLPIPEAYEMYESTDGGLIDYIISGSIHEKMVAFLVLTGRQKNLKILGSQFTSDDTPPQSRQKRPRSNSTVKPEEVAFANLVMGNEEESADLVMQVIANAFKKGAKFVHLIVEDEGPQKKNAPGFKRRIDRQKAKLQQEKYVIVSQIEIDPYAPNDKEPAPEQSGVKKDEPLLIHKNTTRARTKLTICKPREIVPKLSAIVDPVTFTFFTKWKEYRGYWDEYSDDMERILFEEYSEYSLHGRHGRYEL